MKLKKIATSDVQFSFNDLIYNQIDGVAMGSPLGPTLANIFMSHYEQKWLAECPLEFKPKYYRRYVDDIFVMFETIEQFDLFKAYLNTKHRNIKFTSELEKDGKLPFLDMLIDRTNNKIITSIYRKPTFTGLYTRFECFLPSVYKFGLLYTLLFRYFSLCTNYKLFHLEIIELKNIFLKNGYSSKFFDACVGRFLDKIFIPKKIKVTVPQKELFITLPYLGPLSEKTKKRIKNIFKQVLPSHNINVVYKIQCRMSHYFKFKDMIPSDLISNIVYLYKCPSCNAGYVGETSVHSKVRWCQHLGISCLVIARQY